MAKMDAVDQAVSLMRDRDVPELAIAAFARFHAMVREEITGYIPEESIEPLGEVASLDALEVLKEQVREALGAVAVIKLNGGLGTSMGISGPKTALEVRDGLTFLDVIARQVLAIRDEYGVSLPLIVMNSFRTREQSMRILAKYPDLAVDGIPLEFMQSAEPKLDADTLAPVSWAAEPDLEWCPPGHGDVYIALQTSGLLDTLRGKGFRYIFISNSDNLGATCDARIPAWMARENLPYVAEVCERTRNDRKGGHLARRRADDALILRDSAQVVPGEEQFFQDNERHQLFHVNNLWLDLDVLADELARRDGVLELPIITNRKTVDPTDKSSTKVIQIESAMGTAVEVFDGAQPLLVSRERFRPVKTTNELLLLRSDVYAFDDSWQVISQIDHAEPFIDLSDEFTLIKDFESRFPHGVPSIAQASSLAVQGDVTFGSDVVCVGAVTVSTDAPLVIPDGTRLAGAS